MRLEILVLENIDKSILNYFDSRYYNIEIIKDALKHDELINKIKNANIVCIRSKTELTKNVLIHAKNLIAIGCFCIGTNQIDLDYCFNNNIALFNSPYINTRSVAELVICLIVALSRKLGDINTKMHNGIWNKSSKNCFEIRGKTLGIIGYGHVGSQVSVLAESMGMNVLYYDIIQKMNIGNSKKCETLDELLKLSDYVTLHVPLSKYTENLIGEVELKLMKKGAYLLNLSRGNVLNIDSVRKYLLNKHLGGVAIDVFPIEPSKKNDVWCNPLKELENVILTPHIGGSTEEAQYNICRDVSNKLINYIQYGSTEECLTMPNISVKSYNSIRILNIHKNIPGAVLKINNLIKDLNLNISNQFLSTKKEIGYCIIDIDIDIDIFKMMTPSVLEQLNQLDINIKSRVLYI